MIKLTKYSGEEYFLNCDLIEVVESTPDTIVLLTTGKSIVVKESAEQVVNEVIRYRAMVLQASRQNLID